MVQISNKDDVIDSRDIIGRIEELVDEIEINNDACDVEYLKEELEILTSIADECSGFTPDWKHGTTLIRDSYFVDYIKEVVFESGYIKKDVPWWIVIDWEDTAENVKNDYMEVDFCGVTYYCM